MLILYSCSYRPVIINVVVNSTNADAGNAVIVATDTSESATSHTINTSAPGNTSAGTPQAEQTEGNDKGITSKSI